MRANAICQVDNESIENVSLQNPACEALFGMTAEQFSTIEQAEQEEAYDGIGIGDEDNLFDMSCGINLYKGVKNIRVFALCKQSSSSQSEEAGAEASSASSTSKRKRAVNEEEFNDLNGSDEEPSKDKGKGKAKAGNGKAARKR